MEKTNGYCDSCAIYNRCPQFCTKEKDDNNDPIEPCFSREYEY